MRGEWGEERKGEKGGEGRKGRGGKECLVSHSLEFNGG